MAEIPKHPYSIGQRVFVEKIRAAVLANDRFFDTHNWQNVEPMGGRNSSLTKSTYTDRFCVRPMACWVPHLLIPNHMPCCPRCGKRDLVEVNKGVRFIRSPKMLHGVSSHRHLDALCHPCGRCKRRFAGCDRKSPSYDADKMMFFFNFHLGDRFSVDEQLHSFITASYKVPTSQIYQQLVDMRTDRYLFFKPLTAKLRDLLNQQMKHID